MAKALLSEDEVDLQIGSEVADEASDVVANFDLRLQQVRAGVLDRTTAAEMLSRDSHNLRSMSRMVSLPGLATISHRMDDYLADIKCIEDEHIDDLQAFSDKLGKIMDGEEISVEEVATAVRDLPHKKNFDLGDITVTDVEITLIAPKRSAARVVERELAACGYRVSIVTSPFEALEVIIESQPDFVIAGMVMPTLSGADLARALAAMQATQDIPVAVLTSLERGHPDLKGLPMDTGLIRRGAKFGDDLAEVLERFGIT